MKVIKAILTSLKKSPVIFGVLLFYLGAGLFAGIFHGFTGSFASVQGASPTDSAYQSVANTVVGQIFLPQEPADTTASAGEGGGSTESASGSTEEDGSVSGTESDSLSGALSGEEERHYYRYTVVTRIKRLHLRTGPGLTYEIIDWQPKGTEGYVITPGTDWSYLKPDGKDELGYSFNGYLALTEISPDEYPDELKDVVPPIEP